MGWGLFISMKKMNKEKLVFLSLGLILLVHSFVLTKLIYFPYPELFIYPYLINHGLAPYGQILDQHFPGLMFLPVNLNNLGMTTPEIARIWSIGLVVATQLMLFFISGAILKSRYKALVVNLLYLVWQPFFEGWVFWIDSFLPLLLLSAFYCLYRGNQGDQGKKGEKWLFISGLFLGLGVVFKQIVLPLSVFVLVYLIWKQRNLRVTLSYIFGLSLPIVLMVIYLISIEVLEDFWYWTVTFNLTTFAQFGRGGGPSLAHLTRVLLVFGSVFLVVRKIRFREAQIVTIFLIGALLGLSTRFDFVHFQPALPFALMAFVFVLGGLRKFWGLGVITLYSLITVWWLVIFYKGHLGDRVISFDSRTKILASKIKDYTRPGEKIFVFGAQPHLYQMSETLPAGDIFVFQFPWFFQVAEKRILEGIIKDQPRIIVSDRTTEIEDQRITDFGRAIDQYINQNYQKIDNVGTTDILRRKG